MTFLEAKQHLARKLDLNYSDIANDGLFTDSDLGAFIQFGLQRAWDYKPWPFTQTTKTALTGVSQGYYDYPPDMMRGSAYLLIVGGNAYQKLFMQDYLAWFQANPSDQSQFWSENGTFIFINQLAYTQGVNSFDVYGRGIAPTLSNTTDLLPFSPTTDNEQYSGNEVIVQLAHGEVLDSEKKRNPQGAEVERKKAYQSLDLLWKPFADQKANMQSQTSLFNAPNFFPNYPNNSQTPIGNFNMPNFWQ